MADNHPMQTGEVITRRQFVRGAAAAGALLATPQFLLGDQTQTDANTVALLSDPHVGRVVYARTLKRCLSAALAARAAAAHIIIPGDLSVSHGGTGSYQRVLKVLQQSQLGDTKLHLMLGNHDRRARFFKVLKDYARPDDSPVKGRHVGMVETPHANWLLLDSLPEGRARPLTAGRLGSKQIAWMARTLDAHKDKPAVIVAHHHLKLDPPTRLPMYLKESDAVMAMLLARPQVKAWINGHVHVYTVVRHKGLCMVSLPSTSYTLPGRPLGWVLATARPDGMDLTLKTSSAKHRDHDRKTTLRWRADS